MHPLSEIVLIGSVTKCLILGVHPNGSKFDIRKEFERMDDDKNGVITLHEVESVIYSQNQTQNQGNKKVLCFLNQRLNEFISRQALAQIYFST